MLSPEITHEENQYINQMKPWQLAICQVLSNVLFIVILPFVMLQIIVNFVVDLIIKLFKI
jgi:methionyl-tRNA synthetase